MLCLLAQEQATVQTDDLPRIHANTFMHTWRGILRPVHSLRMRIKRIVRINPIFTSWRFVNNLTH